MANRHQSRESCVEVLYAWMAQGEDPLVLEALILDRHAQEDRKQQDRTYLSELVHGVVKSASDIQDVLADALGKRKVDTLGHIEYSILRMSIWELIHRQEIPYRVIINESLELARDYVDEPARVFVNGALDQLAKKIRTHETAASRAK